MDELEEVAGGIHRARHGVGEGNVDLKKWKRDQIIISQNP